MVTEVETVERLPWEEPDTVAQAMAVDELPDEIDEGEVVSERAIAVMPPQHHVIVGLGTLAAMSEADYQARKAELQTGMARLKDLVASILVKGEDYGTVQGIEKPFLHQPGAEKLSNFFGLAVRQEAERIDGRRAVVKLGSMEQESGEWLSPPFAYHVRSFVHLGDFNGPIVAQGFGEANAWEDKYRYRWQNPTCPTCGREGLIKRKSPANLAGKWNCPNWQNKGGCNAVFEPNDERIAPATKVEYENPYSNAETILLMAAKRSLVSSVRRATGTSGLFTQDEDAPSVRAQAGDAFGDDGEAPKVENVPTVVAAAGGKQEHASNVQLRELVELSKEKELGPEGIAALMKRVLGKTVGESAPEVSDAAKALTGDEIGKLLSAIRTGEVPEVVEPVEVAAMEAEIKQHADTPAEDFAPLEPAKPRRGRPPGSKNKPKVVEKFVVDSDPGFPPQSSDEM